MKSFLSSRALPFFTIIVSCGLALSSKVQGEGTEEGIDFFERNVRPLLAEKCFSCHGRGQRKGLLSLDTRPAMMAGGESGAVVVEGKPEDSPLIDAIEYLGTIQMPPDGKLADREVEVLKTWISLGLPWPNESASDKSTVSGEMTVTEKDKQFWSFRPIRSPEVPTVKQTDWVHHAIDRFVLNRLEEEGLTPVEEADRRTYIRRASFDLTGLPPTESEIDEFVNDGSVEAYDRLIERLLNSPQYGVRWSRHWLDIARYGEDQAHTFQARQYPSGYRYRDWVIDAFNSDLPIDQFIFQQIAVDLLPSDETNPAASEDRKKQMAALGFFALGPVYYADAGCGPKAKADEYDDRIDTLTRGVLGLTVSCARCHDHKFDPISTRDYYSLAGIFSSSEYAEVPLVPPEIVQAYNDGQAAIKKAEQDLKEGESQATRKTGESLITHTSEYLLAAWKIQNRRKHDSNYKSASSIEGTSLQELVVDRWIQALQTDPLKGNQAFKPWYDLVASQDTNVDLSSDSAAIDSIKLVTIEIQGKFEAAIKTRCDAEEVLRQEQSQANQPPEAKRNENKSKLKLPDDVASLLNILLDSQNAPLHIPRDRLDSFLTDESKQALAALKTAIDDQKKIAPKKYEIVHALTEGKPANQKIQIRGNVNDLGEEAPRRFLELLSPPDCSSFEKGSGRLELAKAIASPDNPLTARVFVNRVWQHHFGRGIVATPSNFGLLGIPPTHPELLDYLAANFIASGWSLKQLHRDIMLSATYRLASSNNDTNYQKDPDNKLLWRMNRRRLDIESWRDAMLMVAGNLDLKVGGPSNNLADKNNRRRTLYASISRHELNPVLRLFDFPDPNLTSERRSLTTVPMQQLFVLNSDFMVDQSRAVVAKIEKLGFATTEAKIDQIYRWTFGRKPSTEEIEIAILFLDHVHPEGISPSSIKLSRMEQFAQALLSTNEFFFVD